MKPTTKKGASAESMVHKGKSQDHQFSREERRRRQVTAGVSFAEHRLILALMPVDRGQIWTSITFADACPGQRQRAMT